MQPAFTRFGKSIIKAYFEGVFTQWGLPEIIKVDNGQPWKNSLSHLLTVLALWWIGLGIEVHWNRPRRPQENAVVENLNGLVTRWTELHQKESIDQLNDELTWIGIFQRKKIKVEKYNQQTRLQKSPSLNTIIRPYTPDIFDFNRCKLFLQNNYHWVRIISKVGQIDFAYQRIYISRKLATQNVYIIYKADAHLFEITNEQNVIIKSFDLKDFNQQSSILFSLFQGTSKNE